MSDSGQGVNSHSYFSRIFARNSRRIQLKARKKAPQSFPKDRIFPHPRETQELRSDSKNTIFR